jgi:type II secretory pathway pseudopilin PulG
LAAHGLYLRVDQLVHSGRGLVMGMTSRHPALTKLELAAQIGSMEAASGRRSSEGGYMLLLAVFLLALLTLSLAIAVPRITKQIQRDRELETMHRGKQYARAIQLYFRKFHKYPPDIDSLADTDGIRFLRKRYVDPITRKDDWQPILFGQNKLPTAIGFFGMTTAGLPIAAVGSEGNGSSPANASGLPQSGFGQSGSGQTGFSGMNANSGTNNTDSGPQGAQSFGGAGLIGVSIPSEKRSILVYKRQQQFDLWEFVYDPTMDVNRPAGMQAANVGAAGVSPSSSSILSGPPTITTPGAGPTTSPNGNLGNASQGSQGCATVSPNGNLPVPCQ